MTNNPSEKSRSKKSMLIGFLIGFVITFAATFFWFNRSSDTDSSESTKATAGEMMKQEATDLKIADKSVLLDDKASESTSEQSEILAGALIARMFSNDEVARKNAKKELVKNYHDNSVAMAKLIEVCSNEFDKKDRNDNGIFQGIDVLFMVAEKNPATLRKHKAALYAFFEKTKGQYRESTQERIEKMKGLIDSDR